MPTYICPRCQKVFDRKSNYEQHLRRKLPCPIIDIDIKQTQLVNCNIEINGKNLDETIDELLKIKVHECKKRGKQNNENIMEIVEADRLELQKLREEVEKLKNKPQQTITNNNQNILQVVCIKPDDNYLDTLTHQLGDFHQALDFIKDCALSSLTGDCKLLNKIYFETRGSNEPPIKYLDKSQSKIEYFNDKLERVIDYRGQRLGRILANNLQNSYLKGVNYLINKNLESRLCPNKFLEEYDVQSWNQHIYELSDVKYQRKIVSQLEIPIVQSK